MAPDREAASDARLLALSGEGDERALGELYSRYSSVVFSFVRARVADHEVAEEVSADVWLGCWRSARAFRGDSKVLTWLLGIAKRQIYMHTRGQRQLHELLQSDVAEATATAGADPGELVVAADQHTRLLSALDALPRPLLEVVRLAWLHELPYAEIATAVGVPVGTVKSRVSRARGLLREELRRKQDV